MIRDLDRAAWRKSSHSGGSGSSCVELAPLAPQVGVRDSKDPQGPKIVLDPAVFAQLADRIKAGELDLP